MRNEETIDKCYKEAVKGLNEITLQDKDLWYSYVINLPLHLQVAYTIIVFHQQVFNGGLHQFFFNAYGQFAYVTIEHLKLIKAFKTSNFLERGVRQINMDKFNIDEFREKIFNRTLDRIADFDEKLSETLELLDDGIRQFRGRFRTTPDGLLRRPLTRKGLVGCLATKNIGSVASDYSH